MMPVKDQIADVFSFRQAQNSGQLGTLPTANTFTWSKILGTLSMEL